MPWKKVQSIDALKLYLHHHILPVVADWPGQVFIRKAISLYLQKQEDSKIPDIALSFIPIMGPLHVQLNLIGSILKNFWSFFNLEYKYLFSTSKKESFTKSKSIPSHGSSKKCMGRC